MAREAENYTIFDEPADGLRPTHWQDRASNRSGGSFLRRPRH